MQVSVPPRRYLEGIVIAQMDSSEEWGDREEDKIIKTVFVRAIAVERGFDLVVFVEVEVVAIEGGNDEGFIEPAVEAFRIPFPLNSNVRKAILRHVRLTPLFRLA